MNITGKEFKGREHGLREMVGLLLAAEVEPINLTLVSPLMKRRCCLVVFEALENGTVDHNLRTHTNRLENLKLVLF